MLVQKNRLLHGLIMAAVAVIVAVSSVVAAPAFAGTGASQCTPLGWADGTTIYGGSLTQTNHPSSCGNVYVRVTYGTKCTMTKPWKVNYVIVQYVQDRTCTGTHKAAKSGIFSTSA